MSAHAIRTFILMDQAALVAPGKIRPSTASLIRSGGMPLRCARMIICARSVRRSSASFAVTARPGRALISCHTSSKIACKVASDSGSKYVLKLDIANAIASRSEARHRPYLSSALLRENGRTQIFLNCREPNVPQNRLIWFCMCCVSA